MPIARVGDINLEHYIEGEGPPLLMIMGFAGQASSWGRPVVEALADHFTTIRFSNRGTGQSDKPEAPFTIRQMADDAIALLDALGYGRVRVFGISMGGMIAQELVLAHPERVHGLVLGCTTAGGATNETATPETLQALLPAPGMTREEMVRKAWPAICAPAFIESGREFLEGMMAAGFDREVQGALDKVKADAKHAIVTLDAAERARWDAATAAVIADWRKADAANEKLWQRYQAILPEVRAQLAAKN